MSNFKVYKVGGAVRDYLLNIPNSDIDYVVVGATIDELVQLGYIPVGRDFPVLLHPHTKAEYALARSERKTGLGYHGFTFYTDKSVTLAEDLQRRDITINAMAMDEDNNIIDPFGGRQDLNNKIIRHVSPAFSEDPLRVLRVARFKAQLGFSIAAETLLLMQQICANKNELASLAKERIRMELTKTLAKGSIIEFLDVLASCNALDTILVAFKPIVLQQGLRNEVTRLITLGRNQPALTSEEQLLAIYYVLIKHTMPEITPHALEEFMYDSYLHARQYGQLQLLCLDYTQMMNFSALVTNASWAEILQLYNKLQSLVKKHQSTEFYRLLALISELDRTQAASKLFIDNMQLLDNQLTQIDYNTLLANIPRHDIAQIVHNKKLEIIRLTLTKEA